MTVRRLLLVAVLLGLLAPHADAQNIKATEVSQQMARFRARSAPSVSGASECKLWLDSSALVLKASCAGRSASTLSGGGNGTTSCQEIGGTMTCAAFDSPADATTGGCVTLKEGSNNGSSTAKLCAPANLSTARINTLNVDGSLLASDVETSNASELGLDAIFSPTTGALAGRSNPTYIWLPDGAPNIDPSGASTSVLTANGMRCVTFTARDGIKSATSIAHYVATLGGTCSTCIYADADAGALIAPLVSGVPATASDCTSTGTKTMTGLDAFTLVKGTRYRLCTTSSSNLTQWAKGPYYPSAIANMVATTAGNAASTGTSGKCPTTTGALTNGDVFPPVTRVY